MDLSNSNKRQWPFLRDVRHCHFLKSRCDSRIPLQEPLGGRVTPPCVYLLPPPRGPLARRVCVQSSVKPSVFIFFPRKLFFLKSKCDPRTPRKEPPRWPHDSPMRISSSRGPLARWACVQSSVKPSVFIFFPERL